VQTLLGHHGHGGVVHEATHVVVHKHT
jgi:hypothetical protein